MIICDIKMSHDDVTAARPDAHRERVGEPNPADVPGDQTTYVSSQPWLWAAESSLMAVDYFRPTMVWTLYETV